MSKKSKLSSAKKSNGKKAVKAVKKSAVKKAPVKKSKPASKKSAPVKSAKKSAKKITAPKKAVKKPAAKTKKAAPKKLTKKVSKPVAVKSAKVKALPKKTEKPVLKKVAAKAQPVQKPKVTPVKEVKPSPAKKTIVVEKPAPKKEVEKPIEKPKALAAEVKTEPTKVLAITNTIPKAEVPEISPFKIASISSSITNPVRKNDSYSVKVEKEPAGKYELEFVVRSSPEMLFEFLSSPSGLSEWFCDDVNIRNGIYTFIWDGQLQQARLLKTIDDQLVRFQWVDKTDGSYFEFKIQKDDLTNDTSLIVTDFADSVSERESSKLLWQSQVDKLMHIIGSIF